MTDTIRAALARLISASAAAWGSCNAQDKKYLSIEIARACAALAQPEPEVVGPSDDELGLIYHDCCGGCEFMDQGGFEDAARAVLARWGRPSPAPAGEVAESSVAPVLEPALARINDILNDSGRIFQTDELEALELAREALQQRQAAPVPVAVSERLPGEDDCNVDGMLWRGRGGRWALLDERQAQVLGYTHWLPATALPLPSGEAQP